MAYKMAIIGLGGMGNWHFENITKSIPEIKVVAAYDIREEVQEEIVKKKLKCYANPEELYADKEIDLVLVSTPNDTHKKYAVACLRAGKNVISEKPVTMNVAELEEIMKVSKEEGKFFTIHQNRRWDTDYLAIKKVLADGVIKEPFYIESRVQGSRQYLHGWRGAKINGGGMVYDWGVHLLDQMLNMFPYKIVSVDAHLFNLYSEEVDDNFVATMRFENGLTYLVNVAMNCFIAQPRWHVSSEDGTLIIADWEDRGHIVKLSDKAGELNWDEKIVYTAAGPTRSMAPRPIETTEKIDLPKVDVEWTEYYKNIVQVLGGKAELIVTPEQALRVMRVIEAIFESSRTKQSVQCSI